MKPHQHKHALPGGSPTVPPAVAAADERMAAAKARFSAAALACLRAAPNAHELVQRALQEVDAARAALRKATDAS